MTEVQKEKGSQPDNGPRVSAGSFSVEQPLPSSDTPVSGNLALAPEPEPQLSLAKDPTKIVAGSDSAAANDAAMTPAQPQPEAKMSKGEKIFDWSVYKGLNYWVNLISSVLIADYFINPESKGRQNLDKSISRMTQGLTKMGVALKSAHHNSKVGLETFALLSGGTLLLVPLKLLEDRKRKSVHWINKKLGVDQTGADGKELTPDEIHIEKEQPKQSWANVIWRRVLASLAVVGVGLGVDHLGRDEKTILPEEKYDLGFAKVTYDAKVLGGKERITNNVFGAIDKATEAISGKKFAPNGRVSRWTKLFILDSVFTAITAGVMWVTNGAKKGKMPKEKDNTNDPKVIVDKEDDLVTADEIPANSKAFADRVDRRVNNLIDARRDAMPQSFAESVKSNEAAPAVGV